ncbi:MAG: ribosome small subunit-dependent GTPase A [bacterium]
MNAGLEALGFDDHFARQITSVEEALVPGRVAFQSRGFYQVLLGPSQSVLAELKGSLRHLARDAPEGLPSVGDWVLLDSIQAGRALIVRALKRRNALNRREQSRSEAGRRFSATQVLAANVDWGLITSSLNDEWNERRLKRYIGLVAESGARPAVLLTKADLAPDQGAAALSATQALSPDLPVLLLDAPKGRGVPELLELLEHRGTAVLLGSSGVGKSTLVNALLGSTRMATGAIRERDDRGRHTTVARHLLPLPLGGCLIDSPGLRDLGLVTQEGSDSSDLEIAALARTCRFSDCGHSNEPGCAVLAALEQGSLDPGRWRDYVKLRTETKSAGLGKPGTKGRR